MRSQIPIFIFSLFTLYASASPIGAGPDTALQIQSSLDETMKPIDYDPHVYVTQHGWNDATARLSDVLKGAFRLSSLFTGSSNDAPEGQENGKTSKAEQPQRQIRAARRRRGHPWCFTALVSFYVLVFNYFLYPTCKSCKSDTSIIGACFRNTTKCLTM